MYILYCVHLDVIIAAVQFSLFLLDPCHDMTGKLSWQVISVSHFVQVTVSLLICSPVTLSSWASACTVTSILNRQVTSLRSEFLPNHFFQYFRWNITNKKIKRSLLLAGGRSAYILSVLTPSSSCQRSGVSSPLVVSGCRWPFNNKDIFL